MSNEELEINIPLFHLDLSMFSIGEQELAEWIMIDKRDNVITALSMLEAGKTLRLKEYREIHDITVSEPISFGHKCAICKISKGEKVIKYGESIGVAERDIAPGEHVHIHNLRSLRGSVRR